MQHLLIAIIAIGASLANANHLHKREEGLKCESLDSCVNWYTTGSAQCSDDYEHTTLEVSGYPPGSYCEKPCNDSEQKACAAGQCSFYTGQCNTYPGSTICAKALVFCDAPIKTTKDNCVQLRMGQPVKYDEAAGTCEVDPEAETDDHYLRFVIGKTSVDLNLFMTCAPVTAAGAASVAKVITDKTNRCDYPDTSAYEIAYRCKEGKEKFKEYEDAAREACAVAAHPGNTTPVFTANKG